jgi:hypothetical protein
MPIDAATSPATARRLDAEGASQKAGNELVNAPT